jgi:hypothetical protein
MKQARIKVRPGHVAGHGVPVGGRREDEELRLPSPSEAWCARHRASGVLQERDRKSRRQRPQADEARPEEGAREKLAPRQLQRDSVLARRRDADS